MSMNLSSLLTLTGSADNLALGGAKLNTHWHEYDAVLLTNRTGAGLVAGDVVRLSGVNASSVVTGDVVATHRPIVVTMATIADTATGEFARGGSVIAKSTGAIGVGNYVRKSATAKAIEDTGVSPSNTGAVPDGTIGVALAAAAGGFCLIDLWPVNWIKTNNLVSSSGTDQVITGTSATDITGTSVTIAANTLAIAGGIVSVEIAGVILGDASGVDETVNFTLKYGASTLATKSFKASNLSPQHALSAEPFVIIGELSGHGATNQQRGFMRVHSRQCDTTTTAKIEVSPVVVRSFSTEDSTTALVLKMTANWNTGSAHSITIERVRVVQPPT